MKQELFITIVNSNNQRILNRNDQIDLLNAQMREEIKQIYKDLKRSTDLKNRLNNLKSSTSSTIHSLKTASR